MISRPLKLGFLASANGTSARAIVVAAKAGELAAEPRLLVSNKRDAPALAWAQAEGVPALAIPTVADPDAADARLAEALAAHGVEIVVLSGYLRRLGPQTLARYAGRVLNIHPGPLPAFGGEGMYGRRVHEAVLASGVRETEITIHLVDAEYDRGPVLARAAEPVLADDTVETLAARVAAREPLVFIDVLKRIAAGEIALG